MESASSADQSWILRQQIFAIKVISAAFAIGVLPFAWLRFSEGNVVVGTSQLLLSLLLGLGFFRLRQDPTFYRYYSVAFMVAFFLYSAIIFFYVPQNHLNILWVVAAPILIFFFLNRLGGIVMFIWVMLFIAYLVLSGHPYTPAEYITLLAAFLTTTFVMYIYERIKEGEKRRLMRYGRALQREVARKTADLKALNEQLEARVREEVDRRIEHEQMLLRQSRMACMGEMIDAIAHQWRQPLMHANAVLVNLQHDVEAAAPPRRLNARISEVFALTEHMSRTIDDFRKLLEDDKEKTRFDVEGVVDEVLELLRGQLKNIAVDARLQKGIVLESYRGELAQVLVTLLVNASEVLAARGIAKPTIVISLWREDARVKLAVEDNAGGVETEYMQQIFEPYFTTKRRSGGTGIGLYIARIIAERNMGGRLDVHNVNDGARFVLTLPAEVCDA